MYAALLSPPRENGGAGGGAPGQIGQEDPPAAPTQWGPCFSSLKQYFPEME